MKNLFYLAALATLLVACKDDDTDPIIPMDKTRTFKVVIENVSTDSTLAPGALPDRSVPLSHGVWVISSGLKLFTLNEPADEGTSRIAEDGMTTIKTNDLNNHPLVSSNGEFVAPGGPQPQNAIHMGESSMFMVKAKPGELLQIQSMFVQSNDWFFAFKDNGLPLFIGETPITGNVTSQLALYDAGTEADEAPGLGITQAPDQGPTDTNVGPDDTVNMVKFAHARHTTFTIPATNQIIKITITPQ